MKKILLSFATLCSLTLFGQTQTNLNLNDWSDDLNATNWDATLNILAAFGGDSSVVRTAGSMGNGAKLRPVDLSLLGLPVYASLFNYGTTGAGEAKVTRTDSVYFDAKAILVGTVQANVSVAVTKYNTTTMSRDTLGSASVDFTSNISNYTKQKLKITYNPAFAGVAPDTISILASIIGQDAGVVGTELYVDEFKLVDVSFASVPTLNSIAVTLFPNPTTETLNIKSAETISSVSIFGTDGKLVLNSTSNIVNVSKLNKGTYIAEIKTVNGSVAKETFIKE